MLRINAMIQEDALNQYDVEIQKKFALAVACVIFVLLGAPIALRFPRGGVGLVIGVSLGVFALYYVALIAGESAANAGYLPPVVAMWAANAIFGAAGLALLARMGQEGATSRGGDMGELMEGVRLRAARLARRVGIRVDRRQR
jgi:lipopolysaccharide export system permease protein